LTLNNSRYIIVFTDYFSRWVEAVPIPNKEAKTVAHAFVREIICRYGGCKELLSDRGTEFLNEMMSEVCKLCNMHKKNTTAFHPSCNGLTERFNKVLGTMLAIYTHQFGHQWDTALHFILFAYRSSVQSTLKFSPYKILFGREACIPGELSAYPEQRWKTNDYADHVAASLQAMKAIIRNNLLEAQERQKYHYDKDKTEYKFVINKLVWLRAQPKGQGAKLQPKWASPYVILATPNSTDSVIRLWSQPTAPRQLVHNNRLKPCHAPWQPPPVDDDDEDDDLPLAVYRPSTMKPSDKQHVLPQADPQPRMQDHVPVQEPIVMPSGSLPLVPEMARPATPIHMSPPPTISKTPTPPSPPPIRPPPPVICPSPTPRRLLPIPPCVRQPTNVQPPAAIDPAQVKATSTSVEQLSNMTSRIPTVPQDTSSNTVRTRGAGLRANPRPPDRYQPAPWGKRK